MPPSGLSNPAATQDIARAFEDRFTKLAGKVHWADGPKATAEAIAAILTERRIRRLVKTRVASEVEEWLLRILSVHGVEAFRVDAGSEVASKIAGFDAGLTEAAFAIAETGTIVEMTFDDADRLVSALPRVHVSLLRMNDIVPSIKQAVTRMSGLLEDRSVPCVISFISGPSRTGDIEMRLVLGVHGPHEVHAIIIR